MMKSEYFHIEWDTGFTDVNIRTFFTETTVSRIKKLCKLARQYSDEEERTTLLNALIEEDQMRKNLLNTLGELSYKRSELANAFYRKTFEPETGWAEKLLLKERKKLARAIDIIKAERWGV